MSGAITAVLNATFGLLVNKVRDVTAKKLKEGDLADEQCKQLIVRELDDIKSKLDGLARKDLLSSVNFFKEGLNRLYLSIACNSPNDETKQEENEDIQQANRATMTEASGNGGEPSVLHEPLKLSCAVSAVRRSKVTSTQRFKTAKKSFKAARERATDAFSNEALSTEDRILAIKLRMASTIFESLEDPDAAANDCLLYLQDLHAMPAVQEMFSVYLDGGIIRFRSRFNKARRFEIVKSVTMVNFALFGFTKAFTKTLVDLINWPRIEIGKRSYHPLYDQETKIFTEMKNSGLEAPSCEVTCEISKKNYRNTSAVNSKREIIVESKVRGNIDVINSQGEIKLFCSLPEIGKEALPLELPRHWPLHELLILLIFFPLLMDLVFLSLAIDGEDNVYIVTISLEQTDNVHSFKLSVFDPEGNLKHQFPLECLSGKNECVEIAINMAKDVIIHKAKERRVHVYKSGQLQHSFPLEENIDTYIVYLSITHKNEIVVAAWFANTVSIYSEEGELKQTIELPEDHKAFGVAFDHITKKVIVYTKVLLWENYLLSYSETGELRTLPLPTDDRYGKLTSHPSGPVAFVHGKGVVYLS